MSFESRVNALGSGLQTAKVRLEDVRARHESAGHRPVLKALQGFFLIVSRLFLKLSRCCNSSSEFLGDSM